MPELEPAGGSFLVTNIDTLLGSYRAAGTTERDKGTYFERLCAAFLTADLSDVSTQRTDWGFEQRGCGHRADSPPFSWLFSAKRR
jgi:hypothetical protein